MSCAYIFNVSSCVFFCILLRSSVLTISIFTDLASNFILNTLLVYILPSYVPFISSLFARSTVLSTVLATGLSVLLSALLSALLPPQAVMERADKTAIPAIINLIFFFIFLLYKQLLCLCKCTEAIINTLCIL